MSKIDGDALHAAAEAKVQAAEAATADAKAKLTADITLLRNIIGEMQTRASASASRIPPQEAVLAKQVAELRQELAAAKLNAEEARKGTGWLQAELTAVRCEIDGSK